MQGHWAPLSLLPIPVLLTCLEFRFFPEILLRSTVRRRSLRRRPSLVLTKRGHVEYVRTAYNNDLLPGSSYSSFTYKYFMKLEVLPLDGRTHGRRCMRTRGMCAFDRFIGNIVSNHI